MVTRVMYRARFVLLLVILCAPYTLEGQTSTPADGVSLAMLPTPVIGEPLGPILQQPGEKSTWLAGILSFFIPFGTGSFYAGNTGHGIRHLVIGGTSFTGMMVGWAIACEDWSEGYCDEDSAGWYVAGGFALVYLGNWIWGTVAAVSDASAYNRRLAEVGFAPEFKMLAPVRTVVHGASSTPTLGLQLFQVPF